MFDATHARDRPLVREGLADGLRVDHPDGLADPGGYLDRLARCHGGAYVLVEKILEGDERLPPALAHRRHDRLRRARRHRPRARRPGRRGAARRARHRCAPDRRPDRTPTGKRSSTARSAAIADGILRSEVLAGLERMLPASARPAGAAPTRSPSCSRASRCTARTCRSGREHLDEAARLAARHRPTSRRRRRAASAPVRPGASGRHAVPADERHGHGQGRGGHRVLPLHAAWSLTEVGGDPAEFAIDVDAFHARAQRPPSGGRTR